MGLVPWMPRSDAPFRDLQSVFISQSTQPTGQDYGRQHLWPVASKVLAPKGKLKGIKNSMLTRKRRHRNKIRMSVGQKIREELLKAMR
jgi:hypothetical protein